MSGGSNVFLIVSLYSTSSLRLCRCVASNVLRDLLLMDTNLPTVVGNGEDLMFFEPTPACLHIYNNVAGNCGRPNLLRMLSTAGA